MNFIRVVIVITAFIATISASPVNWRIIGGSNATIGQFPHMVSLSYKFERNEEKHICGGVILSIWWILTAAHCVAGYKPERFSAKIGTISLSKGGIIYPVSHCTFHADYDPIEITDDIGLVRLLKPITFIDGLVSPLSLNPAHLSGEEQVTVAGWGSTVFGGPSPDILQWLETTVLSQEECREGNKPLTVTDGMICTLKGIGHGACHGDSGGFLRDETGLVGIVSWGRKCAEGYPDVFTRISFYFSWIQNTINKGDNENGRFI